MQQYQIFGSEDSVDLDIVFFVDELGTIQQNLQRSKELCANLPAEVVRSKQINANLAVLDNGVISKVYKGTADELNNSLRRTYALHTQSYDLQINTDLPRDKDLKLLRTVRKTLSFFSRTELRPQIKHALRSGFIPQIEVLESHDLTAIEVDATKAPDIWKVILFSIAQVLSLEERIELYTKQEIVEHYPELTPIMQREAGDHQELCRKYLAALLRVAKASIDRGMTSYFEYDYPPQERLN